MNKKDLTPKLMEPDADWQKHSDRIFKLHGVRPTMPLSSSVQYTASASDLLSGRNGGKKLSWLQCEVKFYSKSIHPIQLIYHLN